MDDLITEADEDQRAFDIYQKSKEMMSKGGFNLRKWNSNSKTLLQKIELFIGWIPELYFAGYEMKSRGNGTSKTEWMRFIN